MAVGGLLGDPFRSGLHNGASEGCELLVYHALPFLEVHQAFLFPIGLKSSLRHVQLRQLLLYPLPEPSCSLRRSRVAELERLLDVELRQGIGSLSRDLRVVGREAKVHKAATLNGLYHDPGPKSRYRRRQGHAVGVDRHRWDLAQKSPFKSFKRGKERSGLELRTLLQPEAFDGSLSQNPAVKKLILSLVVVGAALDHVHEFLGGQYVGSVSVNEDLNGGLVDRSRRVVVDYSDHQADADRGQYHASTLVQYREVSTRVLEDCSFVHEASYSAPIVTQG